MTKNLREFVYDLCNIANESEFCNNTECEDCPLENTKTFEEYLKESNLKIEEIK